MDKSNQTNKTKRTAGVRLTAFLVFAVILLVFVLLWLSERGYLQARYFLGVCGFKQKFGLPCPGCGWTHSAQAFVTGDFIRSFEIQPAAAVFCLTALVVAILALHTAVFGLNSYLQNIIIRADSWKKILIAAIVVILLGWFVTFIRAIVENGGF